MELVKPLKELYISAREAEAVDDLEEATSCYEQILKQDPVQEEAYDRLMIIYRKLKLYKQELRTINNGIKQYEKFYKPKATGAKGKKIADLSTALLKSTGLTDKKGTSVYDPEPIGRWKKRKVVVEKKLAK